MLYIPSTIPFCIPKDPIDWIINNATRDHIAEHGFDQNINSKFLNTKKKEYTDANRYHSISII